MIPSASSLTRCWDRDDHAQKAPRERGIRTQFKPCWLLTGLLVHDFRAHGRRRLERAGVAMRLVGLRTEAIYRRYAIVCESDLREAVEKLGAVTVGS
jgi:hypothetical protein